MASHSSENAGGSGDPALGFNDLMTTESMDLSNDPRFFGPNIIDKRLAAFTTVSTISTVMTETAVEQVFELEKDMVLWHGDFWSKFRGWVQTISFFAMTIVLFMNIVSTMVFGIQFFFVMRLMTSGPLGFESAKSFYLHPTMTYWRHMGAHAMIFGLPLFVLACGGMLYVKFQKEGADVRDDGGALAWCVWAFFAVASGVILHVGLKHIHLFDEKYTVSHIKGARSLMTQMGASSSSAVQRKPFFTKSGSSSEHH